MHCPYCRGRITKVVLRRKVPKPKIPAATNIPDSSSDHEILGCASCLSFFVSCGNKLKLLNPLRLFGAVSHDGDTQIPHVPREPKPDVIEPPSSQDDVQAAVKYGWRYNLFWFFGNGKDEVNAIRPPLITPPEGEIRIPVHQEETPPIATQPENYRSLEIVKSIVYGGLMESIVSLSIVSSSAAANATTLNIVVLALANLVGGLVILAHNLKDLRYGENDQISEEKYKKELGRKEYFPLHATVAILSYIVFGLVAPLTYGFTFRETNDRDFKMLAAGIASLVCIFLLGIAKAYTKGQHKFSAYFKTVTYYVTCAVLVSGIAFAIGELARKLVEKYGLFACPSSLRYEPADLLQPITWASY
ncbi:OLC1v1006745C2 [Oldenlandia corymbosa var. corymbosa]|nr:OLC1v1006745C2 [Oldenlandia corymbosa var. corymbosa]